PRRTGCARNATPMSRPRSGNSGISWTAPSVSSGGAAPGMPGRFPLAIPPEPGAREYPAVMMSRKTAPPRPDPAAPWVIDTRDLGRRAGAMRRYHRDVPLPAGLGLDLVEIPPGGRVVLDLRL